MKFFIGFICFFLFSGCAHFKFPHPGGASSLLKSEAADSKNPKTLTSLLKGNSEDLSHPQNSHPFLVEYDVLVVNGKKLKETRFDFPMTINARVEYWIDYFCGRGRGYFSQYLERSEFFIPYIAPLLKQNGLPEDLVYLAMIESGFNNFARSSARAVGPWQFVAATGQRYGLMVNSWVDERRDIQKSTLSAVEYLKDLYALFQSWELAAAAYNAGEGKIARAIQRYGTKDFWVISRQRFLRPETRDYVPKIIAAALITKNRTQFGFPEQKLRPAADEAIAGDGEVVKVVKTDKPMEDAHNQKEVLGDDTENLSIGEVISPSTEEETASVSSHATPPLTIQVSADHSSDQGMQLLAKSIPTPHMTKTGKVGGEELAEFEVKSPADLIRIASASGLSYQTVKALNPEILRWCTPPNASSYRIKLPVSIKEKFLTTYNHVAFPRKVQFMPYKVRRGETLFRIARRYGIKSDLVSDLNRIPSKAPLKAGSRIFLPIPDDRSRTLASLDIIDPPERRRLRRRSLKRRRQPRYSKMLYPKTHPSRSISSKTRLRRIEG